MKEISWKGFDGMEGIEVFGHKELWKIYFQIFWILRFKKEMD